MKEYVVNGKVIEITLENGKVVKAMTSFIETMMKNLDIDMEDAVLTWLEDEEYLINDEQEELVNATKNYKVNVNAGDKAKERKKREVVKKENPEKEMIISELAKVLPAFAENINIENNTKLITFTIGDNEYKIDLVQKRKKKGE
jgi:hypothetical protein